MKTLFKFCLLIAIFFSFSTCDIEQYNLCMDNPLHSTYFGIQIIDADGNDVIYADRNIPWNRKRLYIEPDQRLNAIRFISCDDEKKECIIYIENITHDFDRLSEAAPFLLARNFFEIDTLQFQVEKVVNSCDTEYFDIIDIKKDGQSLEQQDNIFIIRD